MPQSFPENAIVAKNWAQCLTCEYCAGYILWLRFPSWCWFAPWIWGARPTLEFRARAETLFGSAIILVLTASCFLRGGGGFQGRDKAHKHLAHKQFPRSPRSPILPAGYPILPAGYPDENVYVPWILHTAHQLLTPGHRWEPLATRSGEPPPPGQSPETFVYVYVPFPFLSLTKMGENSYELFGLALSLVWFAGATPDIIFFCPGQLLV